MQKNNNMKAKNIKEQIISEGPKIKVKLDSKTFIVIKNLAALAFWRVRYPNAEVLI